MSLNDDLEETIGAMARKLDGAAAPGGKLPVKPYAAGPIPNEPESDQLAILTRITRLRRRIEAFNLTLVTETDKLSADITALGSAIDHLADHVLDRIGR